MKYQYNQVVTKKIKKYIPEEIQTLIYKKIFKTFVLKEFETVNIKLLGLERDRETY